MLTPNDLPTTPRTLSKSDFLLARDCAAKLYFRENGYPDKRDANAYLKLLAEGGYMVEALAKARHPDGVQLEYSRDVAADFARTMKALESPDVTLFEATMFVGRRWARLDILVKRGNALRIVEVKAKSFDGAGHARQLAQGLSGEFRSSRRPYRIISDWDKKVADLAYQVVLLEQCMPGCTIQPVLALVDTSKSSGLDNVPGYFELVRQRTVDGSRLHTARFLGTPDDLARLDLITEVDVAAEVAELHDDVAAASSRFESRLDAPLAEHTAGVERGAKCKQCEFRTDDVARSGFGACWGALAHGSPHMLELFSVGRAKAPDGSPVIPWMLARGSSALVDIPLDGIVPADANPRGTAARQLRQIECTRRRAPFVGPGLRTELERLRGPVHFIDFETSRLALPYHHGMRPYGLVAFQWSAHTVTALGETPRHSEWLNQTDVWPNQSFVESLRTAIGDDGPVLTWTAFEAATLKQIVPDLEMFGRDVPDLVAWLSDVTSHRMVDMHKWACADYYHPGMGGSTSIKRVLDAIWQSDAEMRRQLTEWSGLTVEPSADPYRSLPPVEIDGVWQDVHEGTGAMRAYQEMMYGPDKHDAGVRDRWAGLLKQYCRLDTLSMVLILEHWRREVGLA
jgi:hypothetical protein